MGRAEADRALEAMARSLERKDDLICILSLLISVCGEGTTERQGWKLGSCKLFYSMDIQELSTEDAGRNEMY